jgi:hypothetical protein
MSLFYLDNSTITQIASRWSNKTINIEWVTISHPYCRRVIIRIWTICVIHRATNSSTKRRHRAIVPPRISCTTTGITWWICWYLSSTCTIEANPSNGWSKHILIACTSTSCWCQTWCIINGYIWITLRWQVACRCNWSSWSGSASRCCCCCCNS